MRREYLLNKMKKNLQICFLVITCFYISSCAKKDSSDKLNNRFESATNASKAFVLDPGNYELKLDSSRLNWECGWLGGMSHNGDIKFKNGKIEIKNKNSIAGKFTVNMNEIDCFDLGGGAKSKLISHLKSNDFFSVDNYNEAILEIDSLEHIKENEFLLYGDLMIKDIKNPVAMKGQIFKVENGYRASIKLSFDRAKFNVKYKSKSFFSDLGDNIIDDNVILNANVQLHK